VRLSPAVEAGVFYLKAVAARCDWEPRLTRWLARRFPA
jgi:hypothetical protein